MPWSAWPLAVSAALSHNFGNGCVAAGLFARKADLDLIISWCRRGAADKVCRCSRERRASILRSVEDARVTQALDNRLKRFLQRGELGDPSLGNAAHYPSLVFVTAASGNTIL